MMTLKIVLVFFVQWRLGPLRATEHAYCLFFTVL